MMSDTPEEPATFTVVCDNCAHMWDSKEAWLENDPCLNRTQ